MIFSARDFSFVIQVNPDTGKTEIFILSFLREVIVNDTFRLTDAGLISKQTHFNNSQLAIDVLKHGTAIHDHVCLIWIDQAGNQKHTIEAPLVIDVA